MTTEPAGGEPDEQIEACHAIGDFLLATVADLCAELGVEYFLDAGTLLGAYRRGGWIPWDDDIDLMMSREEYSKFRAGAVGRLPQGVTLIDPETNRASATSIPRVSYDDSELTVNERFGMQPAERQKVVLDVFLFDQAPDSPWVRKVWLAGVNFLHSMQAIRCTSIWRIASCAEPPARTVLAMGLWTVSHMLPVVVWKRLHPKWAGAFRGRNCTHVCVTGHARSNRFRAYPISWFTTGATTISFNGRLHPAPAVAEYLAALFGSGFETPPPVGQRKPHQLEGFRARFDGREWGQRAPDGARRSPDTSAVHLTSSGPIRTKPTQHRGR